MVIIVPQLHPQSLQLFELMCWCWSDKPQHRPTFRQILQVIKADSFTHLLEATPMTAGSRKNQVTAACLKSVNISTPQSNTSRAVPAIREDGFTMTYSTASKVLSPTEVWYGTRCGSCGVICFHQSLTIKVCTIIALSVPFSYTHVQTHDPYMTLSIGTRVLTHILLIKCMHVPTHTTHTHTHSLSYTHTYVCTHNRISSCQLKGKSTYRPS